VKLRWRRNGHLVVGDNPAIVDARWTNAGRPFFI
jgi:hypothetical protein